MRPMTTLARLALASLVFSTFGCNSPDELIAEQKDMICACETFDCAMDVLHGPINQKLKDLDKAGTVELSEQARADKARMMDCILAFKEKELGGAGAQPDRKLAPSHERGARAPERSATPNLLAAKLPVPDDAPFKGAADGSVVMHLFFDLQDPFGKRLMPKLAELVAENAKLKIVFRHHPLAFHKDAKLAHQAAVEAYVQKGNDGFRKMHDLLVANQRKLGRGDLVGYAKTVGLDVPAFEKALDAGTHAVRVDADAKVAEDAGIRGVPAMVIDKRVLTGAQPKSALQSFVAGS
jgi:protein-disulfide isomerase